MVHKLLLAALLASSALAKTDLRGCVSYETIITVPNRPDVYPYGSLIWYVPDSGEVCEFLDCGGGRAPPKTTVPGCGAYEGTETYSPKFIDPKTLGQAPQTDAADSQSTAMPSDAVVVTTQPNPETQESATASAVESENADSSSASSSVPVLTGLPTITRTGSFVESLLTKTSTVKTTAAPEGSSPNASSASDGAASNPAPTSSSVSTAAAGAMPTAGGMLALAAGAAMYAGMI